MENQCSQIMMFRKRLQNRLSPMRYEHSLSVSFTCMSLAMRYGYDMNKAELAGLMHDCGKRYSDESDFKKVPEARDSGFRVGEQGIGRAARQIWGVAGGEQISDTG